MRAMRIIFLLYTIVFCFRISAQEIGELVPCEEIKIMCSQIHPAENVIRNNIEYQKLLNVKSPHPDCGIYSLPEIDFNKYTLLGIDLGVGGCKEPTIKHSVMKLPDDRYEFIVNIKQRGYCKINFSYDIWCLIPKIDETVIVKFTQKIIIEE